MPADEINSLGEEYDYASIMHYSRNTFSKEGVSKMKIQSKNYLTPTLAEGRFYALGLSGGYCDKFNLAKLF